MTKFISFDDAKSQLGIDERELHSFIAQGKLSPLRDGGTVRFRSNEVEAIKLEQGEGIQLNMSDENEGIILDFGTDVSDLNVAEANDTPVILEADDIEEVVEIEEVTLEEPEIAISLADPDETSSLEDVPEEIILIEEDDDDENTIILDDDDDDGSETIVLSDDDGADDTIVLANDDENTETITLENEDAAQSDMTIALSEDEMVAEDDDELAVELAGGAQMTALPEGSYIAHDIPPSLLVTIPLILGFVILIFGGMIIFPLVSNSSPELTEPIIPGYLSTLVDTVRNWK